MAAQIFEFGEEKYITIKIEEMDGSSFTILTAEYSVYDNDGTVITGYDGASATIDSAYIKCLFQPDATGNHLCKITYTIGDETYIDDIHFPVINRTSG